MSASILAGWAHASSLGQTLGNACPRRLGPRFLFLRRLNLRFGASWKRLVSILKAFMQSLGDVFQDKNQFHVHGIVMEASCKGPGSLGGNLRASWKLFEIIFFNWESVS